MEQSLLSDVARVVILYFDKAVDFQPKILSIEPVNIFKNWKIGWNIKYFCETSEVF